MTNTLSGIVYTRLRNLKFQATAKKQIQVSGPITTLLTLTAAALSFAGSTKLITSKGMTGVLSFTGVTNLGNSIVKGLVAATLTFTGAFTRLPIKNLTATLSFTGPPNLLKAINKGITGGLSFTGSFRRAITTALVAASLSFAGAITKFTTKAFIAGLSFTGAITSSKVFTWAMTAGLTFTGAFVKQGNKVLAGSLSFTGATPKRAIQKVLAAGLTFAGSNLKSVSKGFVAGLSFSGAFVKTIQKKFTAGLSFTGLFSAVGGGTRNLLALTASLSFSGSLSRTITFKKVLVATLSFAVALSTPAKRLASFAASMTSTGNLTNFRWYTGAFKQTSKGLFRAAYRAVQQIITQNRNYR